MSEVKESSKALATKEKSASKEKKEKVWVRVPGRGARSASKKGGKKVVDK